LNLGIGMSDLQISLLVVGVVVVGAVYLFNWVQERRLRRRLEEAFGPEHDDVLLKTPPSSRQEQHRVEPQLQEPAELRGATSADSLVETSAGSESVVPGTPAGTSPYEPGFDAAIDFIAEIEADAPIPDAVITELLNKIAVCGKPVRGAGCSAATGRWEDLGRGGGNRSTSLRLAIQLVDRSGPINPAQLASFCDAVTNCARRISARVVLPDVQAAIRLARELDGFCADVDVAIGLNIVAPEGRNFSGTEIRTLAESAGFKLEPDGIFRYRDEGHRTLFTLDNHEPAPFIPEQVKSLSTTGVTLLLDVPRVAGGKDVLNRMIEIGKSLAQALGGRLVDDNRVALSDSGIGKIRQQLRDIHAAMGARGIEAGSARALRLFA